MPELVRCNEPAPFGDFKCSLNIGHDGRQPHVYNGRYAAGAINVSWKPDYKITRNELGEETSRTINDPYAPYRE